MNNLASIVKNLKKIKSTLAKDFKVKNLAIFGSYARRENRKNSDLDILVEFSEPVGFFTFFDLEEYLKKNLKIKIDLVSKKALKPQLGKYILRDLIMI